MMRVVNLWKKLNCVGVCRKNYYDRASSSVEDQMVIMMTTDAASDLTSLGTSFVTSLTSFVTSLSSSVTQQPSSSSSTGFYFQCAVVAVGVLGAAANALILYALVVSRHHVKHLLIFNQNALDFASCLFQVGGSRRRQTLSPVRS